MTHRTHLPLGVAAGIGVIALLDTQSPLNLPALAVAGIASLTPDLDHNGSWISRNFPPLHYALRYGIDNCLTRAIFGAKRTRRAFSHRSGLTHSLLALATSIIGVIAAVQALILALLESGHISVQTTTIGGPLSAADHLLPGLGISVLFGLSWGAGYASHIIADMCTYRGVALFFPWSNRSYGFLPKRLRPRMSRRQ